MGVGQGAVVPGGVRPEGVQGGQPPRDHGDGVGGGEEGDVVGGPPQRQRVVRGSAGGGSEGAVGGFRPPPENPTSLGGGVLELQRHQLLLSPSPQEIIGGSAGRQRGAEAADPPGSPFRGGGRPLG